MPVTEPLFQQDAYRRSCTATVVEPGDAGVVLDRTVFYPLGGGQPGDTGFLRAADGREWRVADARIVLERRRSRIGWVARMR